MAELTNEEWFERYRDWAARHAWLTADIYSHGLVMGLIDRTESPIERRFAQEFAIKYGIPILQGTLCLACDERLTLEEVRENFSSWPNSHSTGVEDKKIGIYPQCKVGDYRVDFLITVQSLYSSRRMLMLAIECDGHDFHDRTKEQAQRDKSRDRYLVSQGITVLRFTGSEIWNNAERYVADLDAVIERFVSECASEVRP